MGSGTGQLVFEVGYRLVALEIGVSSGRKLWRGLVDRKIWSFNPGLLDWRPHELVDRDATPIPYWLEIVTQVTLVASCLIAAIIGRWQPEA